MRYTNNLQYRNAVRAQPARIARIEMRERTVIRDVVAPDSPVVKTIDTTQVVYLDTMPPQQSQSQASQPITLPPTPPPVPVPEAPALPPTEPIQKPEVRRREASEPISTPEPAAIHEAETAASQSNTLGEQATTPQAKSPNEQAKKTRQSLWSRLWTKQRNPVGNILIAIVLVVTGCVSVDTWLTNRRVKQELMAMSVSDAPEDRIAAEGRDEKEVTDSVVDSYQVAPDVPRVITIEKANVRARLLPMGVNSDNSMQAPLNIFDAGWYTSSAKLGEPGATVVDAHASGPTREGLFAYIDTLKPGDSISVERGDGKVFQYKVANTETVPLSKVDMRKVMKPYGDNTTGLNLITCAGSWLKGQRTYDHRIIVYAEPVQ